MLQICSSDYRFSQIDNRWCKDLRSRELSKNKLQCKLHDSRIRRCVVALHACVFGYGYDLAETGGAQVRLEIETPERIRYVERLGSKLQSLIFTDTERSRERQIELEGAWAFNRALAHVPVTAQIWESECFGIQIVCNRGPVPIWIPKNLLSSLATGTVQQAIDAADHRQPRPRLLSRFPTAAIR